MLALVRQALISLGHFVCQSHGTTKSVQETEAALALVHARQKSETRSDATKQCHGCAFPHVSKNSSWQLLLHNTFCAAAFSHRNDVDA